MSAPVFDGATYEAEHDQLRLSGQLADVHHQLTKTWQGERLWWTLEELAAAMEDLASTASISARIRDLRKPRFGGHEVQRRRRGDPSAGLWEYRLGAPGTHQAKTREPVGAELPLPVANWLDQHPEAKTCPGCGDDLSVVGLTRLAYTFQSCTCGRVPYGHLVEQLWHRICLVEQ